MPGVTPSQTSDSADLSIEAAADKLIWMIDQALRLQWSAVGLERAVGTYNAYANP